MALMVCSEILVATRSSVLSFSGFVSVIYIYIPWESKTICLMYTYLRPRKLIETSASALSSDMAELCRVLGVTLD